MINFIRTLLILFISLGAFSANPKKSYPLEKFLGMNRSGYRFNMSQEWMWDHLNGYVEVSPDGKGALVQRRGLSKYNATVFNSATTKIRFMIEASFDNGTETVIVRANDGWYRYDGTDIDTAVDASRTADAKGFAVMWDDQLIMVDGGTPRKCNASYTVTDLSADAAMPTDASAVWVHQQRVWLNSAAEPMKFYGSKVGDATGASAWSTSSDSITVDLSKILPEGDEVIGFRTLGDLLLVVFLKKHIAIYNAPTTFADISIVQMIEVGALSNNAINQVGPDYLYPSRSGVKSLISSEKYQKLDIGDVTQNISKLYRGYITNETDLESICGAYHSSLNHYYITIHESTESNTLVYSPEIGNVAARWQFHASPYSWLELRNGDLLIGMDNGFIYKYDTGENTDDGNTVSWIYEPPTLGTFDLRNFKAMESVEALVELDKTATLLFDYYYGLNDNANVTREIEFPITVDASYWDVAIWDVALWSNSSRNYITSYDPVGRGRAMNVRFRNETDGARLKMSYLIVNTILEGTE